MAWPTPALPGRNAPRPPSHYDRRYWIAAPICEQFRAIRQEEDAWVAARYSHLHPLFCQPLASHARAANDILVYTVGIGIV